MTAGRTLAERPVARERSERSTELTRLPGNIVIVRERIRVCIPITSSIQLSLLLSSASGFFGVERGQMFRRILLIFGFIMGTAIHVEAAPQSQNSSGEKPACHTNDRFVVITRTADMVAGEEIIVRQQSVSEEKNQCNYPLKPSDFRAAKFGEAKYFVAMRQNLLILDQGTGPSLRNISIINMSNGHEIWKALYCDELKFKDMKINILKFVRFGTKKICANYNSIIKDNWTPLYVIPTEFSLSSLKAKATSSGFCVKGQ